MAVATTVKSVSHGFSKRVRHTILAFATVSCAACTSLTSQHEATLSADCAAFTARDRLITDFVFAGESFGANLRAHLCAHAGVEQSDLPRLSAEQATLFERYRKEQRRQISGKTRLRFMKEQAQVDLVAIDYAPYKGLYFWYVKLDDSQADPMLVDLGASASRAIAAIDNPTEVVDNAGVNSIGRLRGSYGSRHTHNGQALLDHLFLTPERKTAILGRDALLSHDTVCLDLHNRRLMRRCHPQAQWRAHEINYVNTLDGQILIKAGVGPLPAQWALLDSGALLNMVSASVCPETDEYGYTIDSLNQARRIYTSTYILDVSLGGPLSYSGVANTCERVPELNVPLITIGAETIKRNKALQIDRRKRTVTFWY